MKFQLPLIAIYVWGEGAGERRAQHVSKLGLNGKAHLEGRKEPQEDGAGRAWARKEENQDNIAMKVQVLATGKTQFTLACFPILCFCQK